MKAIVIGGTGAVGRYVVLHLLENPKVSKVTLIARRKYEAPDQQEINREKLEERIVDMDKMEEAAEAFNGHGAAFCCLGTTRRDAGSAEAFRKVDYGYVVKFAELCKQGGVGHFALLTSTGSNANSWFLYPRTKGEAENAVIDLKFPSTSIFRPGLINRGKDARWVEKFADVISFGMMSIPAATIAKGMIADALIEGRTGHRFLDNSAIYTLNAPAKESKH